MKPIEKFLALVFAVVIFLGLAMLLSSCAPIAETMPPPTVAPVLLLDTKVAPTNTPLFVRVKAETLNVRECPSVTCQALAVATHDQWLVVDGEVEETMEARCSQWLPVRLDGVRLYVCAVFVE